jgi:hypothetical protein
MNSHTLITIYGVVEARWSVIALRRYLAARRAGCPAAVLRGAVHWADAGAYAVGQ